MKFVVDYLRIRQSIERSEFQREGLSMGKAITSAEKKSTGDSN